MHIDQTPTEGSRYRTATNIPFGIKIKFLKVQKQTENTPSLFNIHTHTRSHKQFVCLCAHFKATLLIEKKTNPRNTIIAISLDSNGHCSVLVFC